MLRRALFAAFVFAGVIAPGADALTTAPPACTDEVDGVIDIENGRVALPDDQPRAVVAMFHGYGHTTDSWIEHMKREAAALDIVAIAMEYDRWQVSLGAERTLAAVQQYAHCSETVVAYAVSMGANAAGIALAESPVFDWWIAVEGVHNVTETYLEGRSVGLSGNATAVKGTRDIEEEMGGPVESRPEAYAERTNVLRATDIAGHVGGAVLVHGVMDGLVPSNQSREMQAALRAQGVPVDFYSVVLRGDGEAGTVPEGYVTPLGQNGYQSPFAGHGSEKSTTHRVIRTGFARLAALLDGETPDGREVVVDAES